MTHITRDGPWAVRSWESGDEDRIGRLYDEVYGRPLDLATYRWKVMQSPEVVAASTVWLADTGDRLAGHYAGTPMRFWLNGQEITIIHTCDAMTGPSFRRQGVFSAVALAAHQAWSEAGVPFLIGLPNDQWGSRREYLGYEPQFQAGWYWRPVRPDVAAGRRPSIRPAPSLLALGGRIWRGLWDFPLRRAARGVDAAEVHHPGPAFDLLWRRLRSAYEALVVRDQAWISYRYFETPERSYRLFLASRAGEPVGFLVFRLKATGDHLTAWIADWFAAPDDKAARAALLLASLKAMAAERVATARILLPYASPLRTEIRAAGFWPGQGRFDVSAVQLDESPLPDSLSDPNRWFVMAGDFDIV